MAPTQKTRPTKTVVRGDPIYSEMPFAGLDVYDAGAIKPGHLLEYANGTVQLHGTSAGLASAKFAVELPANEGMGRDGQYDEEGETVLVADFRPGDWVLAKIPVGANIAIHAALESNGDGTLKAGTTNPVARALEARNNSAGSAEMDIIVEVL